MMRLGHVTLIALSVVPLVSCGDLASDPETIVARNRIRAAQADRIEVETDMAAEVTRQRLEHERQAQALELEHQRRVDEQQLALRAVVLPLFHALWLSAGFGAVGVLLFRMFVESRARLLEAQTKAHEAEAKALAIHLRFLEVDRPAEEADRSRVSRSW